MAGGYALSARAANEPSAPATQALRPFPPARDRRYARAVNEPVHEALLASGVIAPVALGGPEEQQWLDCDLASLAEHRLGASASPLALGDACRRDWLSRATLERPLGLAQRGRRERAFWLLDRGERAGTIALGNAPTRDQRIYLSSLYVLPELRGEGVGQRAMRAVMHALAARGLGLALSTLWTWQRSVRFYLQLGMWVSDWRHDLGFFWDATTPPPAIDVGPDEARLSLHLPEGEHVLARARRRGDRLIHVELTSPRERAAGLEGAERAALSTLSLALALAGFPLVRSSSEWERSGHAESGAPEALARRILVWEAWERKLGWKVETPRIPALVYPSWDELETLWLREGRAPSPLPEEQR
jgi:ribosomal protein S18 acetylase RimI-like enzyme